MNEKPLSIFIVSFDWDDLAGKHPDIFLSRLDRDKLHPTENHFLVLSWGPGRYEKELSPNVRVIRRSARLRFFRPLYDFLTYLIAPRLIKKSGMSPDLLMAYDFPFAWALSRARKVLDVPLVLNLQNLPRSYIKVRRSLMMPKLLYQFIVERLATPRIDAVYTINGAVRRYCIERGIPAERIVVFVIDVITRDRTFIDQANKDFLRERFSIPQEQRILLCIARLEGEKGLDRLIDAFAELKRKECALVIAGKGPFLSQLQARTKERGVADRVFFAGQLNRQDVWSAFKGADVFILLSRAEGLGLVFWEAMYSEMPVIGSHADGILETIGANEERGFLWEPEDGIEALEQKLEMCFSGGAQERARRARAYVEEKLRSMVDITAVYALCKKI